MTIYVMTIIIIIMSIMHIYDDYFIITIMTIIMSIMHIYYDCMNDYYDLLWLLKIFIMTMS